MEEYRLIQVPENKYEDMELRLNKLDALEAAGVDNWEGYDDAMREVYNADN